MCQCKNSTNILQNNIVPPEMRGHTTGRLDHAVPEDIKGNNFKCYLMKMMETLKEEMKNSLKENELKINKKVEEINKSLKEIQENQERAIKQAKERVQDL